jgi:hypothetical protein
MTRHLDAVDLVDALDGVPSASRDAHLAQCTACTKRLHALRDAMGGLERTGDVPEPSPFFWEHFSRRVHDAVRADGPHAQENSWWRPARIAPLAAAALIVIAAAAAVLLRDVPSPDTRQDSTTAVQQESPSASEPSDQDALDVESDPDWALVRAVADDLQWEDASEAGIHARPGAADRVAVDMSPAERQELARLLEDELKRTGA